MHSLCVWPSKIGFCSVPLLDSELGSPCFSSSTRKRSKRMDLFHAKGGNSSGAFVILDDLRYSRSIGFCLSSEFDSKHEFVLPHSGLKSVFFAEPKKCSLVGSLVATAWALNRNETSSIVELEESDSVGRCNLGSISESGKEENRELEFASEERIDEEKGNKIDVRALAFSLHSAKTADDVEEVFNGQEVLPLQVYSCIIKGFGWDKKLEAALALVEWLRRKKQEDDAANIGPNIFMYNSLLSVVKQCEQYGETEKIVNDMLQDGVAPNVVTYNTLMIIYVEQGQPIKALDVLEEMQKNGFAPSAASYSTALLAYRRLEDGKGAHRFFVEIKEKYMRGELAKDSKEDWDKEFIKLENFTVRVCYQVLRRWLSQHDKQSANVLELLVEMDKSCLKPSREEYERLIWACTREDHYVVAKELYGRVRERHGEISLSVCNHAIWLMGKAKKWWAALEIYEDLLDKGPQPNNLSNELIISHFNILLTAARRRGIWRWGVRLLNKMEDKGLKPASKQWNAVLAACSKASETSAAVQIFKRMVERGEKPTVVSYGALLSALEKGKLYDEAVRVWEHMLKVGVQPNLYAYTIMASVFSGIGKLKLVDIVIQDMVSSGIEPTVVTYNAIISGCARNGMSSIAYEWFHRMKVQNIEPNDITYGMLIEALANNGKPKLAYDLYSRAKNEGLNPSAKAYDAVVRSLEAYGATIDMSVLGPRPPDKKQKVRIRKTLSEFCKLADVPRRSKPFDRREIYASQNQETR